MPDFVANCAGISVTTGTGNYVITSGTDKHRRIDQTLTDGQEVAYYITPRESDMPGYETGVAIWRSATSTLEVQSVETSSNFNTKVSWTIGDKTIYIVANAATMVNTADTRLATVEYSDLDSGTTPDGAELVAAAQGGDGVSLTVQQIAGTALTNLRGHAKNYVSDYTSFNRSRSAMSITTDGALCDLEPWFTLLSGAGAGVTQLSWLGTQAFFVSTGTTTTGRCALVSTQYVNIFDPTRSFETIVSLGVSAQPSVEAYTAQVGYIIGLPSLATDGMYFQLSAASANWRAVVRVAGVETNTDTGIAGTGTPVGRIYYDPDELETRFYMDNVLVATIANATRVLATNTNMKMAYSIIKSAGTTSVSLGTFGHYYKNGTATLPAGW